MMSDAMISKATTATRSRRGWIDYWDPENPGFWESQGKRIAHRNLVFSIFAEFLGFAVWQVYSVVAALLPSLGFDFSVNQLFWLAALPGLVGATARFLYTFMVPIFGGRNWTIVSVLLLLVPTSMLGVLVQHPRTPFWAFALAATAAGLGGGNFASSMANISYFYPERLKGFALGLNASGGNIGVSIVQLIIPPLIAVSAIGNLVGSPQRMDDGRLVWAQLAGFVWIPLILLSAACAWAFMDNLKVQMAPFREQLRVISRPHSWIMSLLYVGTFGSFIGYSASFPLLISSQFPNNSRLVGYAFIGSLIGAVVRPIGGWLADLLGGARVTLGAFIAMSLAVLGAIFSLHAGSFPLFLLSFVMLFAATGLGNGSTFKMIPPIFRHYNPEDRRRALVEAAAAMGFVSAVGAYGSFLIPRGYGMSIKSTGTPMVALATYLSFYLICILITWLCYLRPATGIRT